MTISTPTTMKERETTNLMAETNNNQQEREAIVLPVDGVAGLRCQTRGVPKQTVGVEDFFKKPKSRPPDKRQRPGHYKDYFAKINAQRKMPGFCSSCGRRPPLLPYRQCERCRERSAKNRTVKRFKAITADPNFVTAILRRIESLEISVARHSLIMRKRYKTGYARGYNKGRKDEFKQWQERPVEMPSMSLSEACGHYGTEMRGYSIVGKAATPNE